MTIERFEEIFSSDEYFYCGDDHRGGILLGLNIITKYLPNSDIQAAEHDIVYACSVEKLIEANITEEDCKKLHELNWHIEYGTLYHYV